VKKIPWKIYPMFGQSNVNFFLCLVKTIVRRWEMRTVSGLWVPPESLSHQASHNQTYTIYFINFFPLHLTASRSWFLSSAIIFFSRRHLSYGSGPDSWSLTSLQCRPVPNARGEEVLAKKYRIRLRFVLCVRADQWSGTCALIPSVKPFFRGPFS